MPSNTANITAEGEVNRYNLDTVVNFLKTGEYLTWPHDKYLRPTGDIYQTPDGNVIDGTTHHRVRIYYSPTVAAWVRAGRPMPTDGTDPLPDRSMIVKEMYPSVPPRFPQKDEIIGWAAMVKKKGAVQVVGIG